MTDERTHAVVGGIIVGLVFGLGIAAVTGDDPTPPDPKVEYKVVHVPSVPKVYTRKVVEEKLIPVSLPESCTKINTVTQQLVNQANRYERQIREGKTDRLDQTLYVMLQTESDISDMEIICKQDIQSVNNGSDIPGAIVPDAE